MEWINAKDKMPKKEVEVLVYTDGHVTHGSYSEIWKTFVAHAHEVPRVTHWMPLPEPPNLED